MMKIYSRTRTRRITITNWLAAVVLFFAGGAVAETTNGLSDAEIQGRQLARQLCEARPVASFTNTGVLQIRDANGKSIEKALKYGISVTDKSWQIFYEILPGTNDTGVKLISIHENSASNRYECIFTFKGNSERQWKKDNSEILATLPFAGSDFNIGDLGLEFFHWPVQKVLPHTTTLKRGREYTLLESTNPNPTTNGYSRVVSWIDKETGGILEAEAYDSTGKLLKDFAPKSFKKVNGQWELQEMEIRNVQTGSRTRLEFDLPK